MTGIDGDRDRPEGQDDWQDGDAEPLETERLALDDADDRLPWLEGPDDDDGEYDDFEEGGNGRLIGFFVMGLLALGALVGAIWWASHRAASAPVVADGSTVEAPSGPYKEVPKDPGGKTFDGTGDTSFAVSEGQTRPAKLGDPDAPSSPPVIIAPTSIPLTRPVPAPTAAPAPAPVPAATPKPVAAGSATGVQVGAFSTKAAAEAGWSKLTAQAGGALSGVAHRVIAGTADNGTIFRLQAVAGDRGAAQELCGRLKARGIACQVK